MKKLLGSITLAAMAFIPQAQADVAGFEIGTYKWTPDYKGTLASDTDLIDGTNIDIQQDLGFSDDSHNIIWASLEHPVPFLPNVKLVKSDLETRASVAGDPNDLTARFIFAGVPFPNSEPLDTTFDMSNTEYTFYYEVLDNWLNLDLGLTLRQYDGEVRLITSTENEFEELDFTIPLLYIKGRADLPFTGFFVDSEINMISYDDEEVSDISFSVGYESDFGLGVKAGMRTFTLEVFEDSFRSDLEFDGSYISVFYHF